MQTEDEVDAALNDLQVTLEGSTLSDATDITQTPELRNYMRFFKYDLCLDFAEFCDFVCALLRGSYRMLFVNLEIICEDVVPIKKLMEYIF